MIFVLRTSSSIVEHEGLRFGRLDGPRAESGQSLREGRLVTGCLAISSPQLVGGASEAGGVLKFGIQNPGVDSG